MVVVTARNPDPIPGESFLRSFHAWRLRIKEFTNDDPLNGYVTFKVWMEYNSPAELANAAEYWDHYPRIVAQAIKEVV